MSKLFAYNSIVVSMLIIYSAIQVYCINQLSINYDEGSFASYGVSILKFQSNKDVILYESKLPITALNMIPRAVEQLINPNLNKNWSDATTDIIRGRYVSLVISILLGLLILKWARRLYSKQVAFFIFLLYLLCPNFLAHGIFVTSDIFACFFMTLALYYLWRFFNEYRSMDFIFMSIATGLSQISKFSMIHLFILIPILTIAHGIHKRRNGYPHYPDLKKTVVFTCLLLLINWLIICSSHFFYQVFLPVSEYSFMSDSFKGIQQFLSNGVSWLPIHFPSTYIKSMDAVLYFDQLGGGVAGSLNGAPYILGESSINGFWYYYFVSLFYKLPIPILFLWLSTIVLLIVKFNKKSFFNNDIFLILPALYYLIYMSFFYSTQVGIRHIMIIFPLLFILSGKAVEQLVEKKKKYILFGIFIFILASVLRCFPHFLPYTNEFILNKKLAFRKIADSNLCYGEGVKYLTQYLSKHKEALYLPDKPTSGKIIMEVNEMVNLNIKSQHKYDWIRSFHPVGHIHSQYLIFEVNPAVADSLKKIH
jgi:hypothetical protein